MCHASWKTTLAIAISLLPFLPLQGQITDCVGAQVICSDGAFNFTPNGQGNDDFRNPKNDPSCLRSGEYHTAWYYFEFREDMPPNSIIEFTITPFLISGRPNPDYDFIIFGADLTCDSLGSSVRCSYANELCSLCPRTGLGEMAMDTIEPASNQDGFIAPMVVQPGQGFYMMLDNFKGDATGFNFKWGGSAAPFLNCLANPRCKNRRISAGESMDFCQNPLPLTFKLNATATNLTNRAKIEWLGTPEALRFLNNTKILQPTVTIPANYIGSLDFILSVTDGDCVIADAVTISVSNGAPLAIGGRSTICQGESTTLSVPNGFKNFRWSTGDTTTTITVTRPGTYAVTATGATGCERTSQVNVVVNTPPKPNITGGRAICAGDPLSLSVGTNFRTVQWSNGRTTPSITVTSGGTYSVTVTDANGCTGDTSINIAERPKPTLDVIGDTTICNGESTSITVVGTFPTYNWSSGERTAAITKSQAGTYTVTVTDANGCSAVDSITIKRFDIPTLTLSGNRTFCEGNTTALSVTTNAPQIRWSNGATTPNITVDTSGTFSVTVTNANGCSNTATALVREQPLPKPVINGESRICPENVALLQVPDTFATYRWSTNATTPRIRVNQPGVYTLQVTDTLGCTSTANFTVSVFPTIMPLDIIGNLEFCPETGTTLGVNNPYTTYKWSNGSVDSIIQITQAGKYALTVTDDNGCTAKDSVVAKVFAVSFPPAPSMRKLCTGDSLELDAGVGFRYNWSTGATTQKLQISTGGDYIVTLTDANNCRDTNTFRVQQNISQPLVIRGNATICTTDSTTLSAPNGFATYRWSNGATTPTIRVNQAGVYTLQVTDSLGCSDTDDFMVRVFPTTPPPKITGKLDFCPGTSTILRVNNPYTTYKWSTGSADSTLQIAQANKYVLTVTDANGCTAQDSVLTKIFAVSFPPAPSVQNLCVGNSLPLNAGAGFRYNWSTGDTTQTIQVNAGGNYTVTLTDANACQDTNTFRVQQSMVQRFLINGKTSFCIGDSTVLTGPNGFAQYRWSNNVTTERLVVRVPGTYQLTVTDANGCTGNAQIEVRVWQLPTPTIIGPTTLCANARDTLRVNGSFRQFQWSTGQQQAQIPIASGGVYQVTVTDDNGCKATDTAIVTALSIPDLKITGDTLVCEGGVASLKATPGLRNYSWSNGIQSDSISVALPGTYRVTATDDNGCIATQSVQLALRNRPIADAGADKSLNCKIKNVALGTNTTAPALYRWTGPGINTQNAQLSNPSVSAIGIYTLTVIDTLLGCASDTAQVRVTDQSYKPIIALSVQDTLDCRTATTNISATGSAVNAQIIYNWYDSFRQLIIGEKTQNLKVLQGGIYYFEVQDTATGCTAIDSILVQADFNPTFVDAGPSQHLTCDTLIATLTGATSSDAPNILYNWTTTNGNILAGANTPTPMVDQSGKYILTITNANNGCSNTDSVEVSVDRVPPTVEAGTNSALNCTDTIVTLQGTASANGAPLTTFWTASTGVALSDSNQLQINIRQSGTYILKATNLRNGCVAMDSVLVTDESNPPTDFKFIALDPSCFGSKSGQILIQSVTGGTAPYVYRLNDTPAEQSPQFNNLEAGNYRLRVEDREGCAYETQITLKNGAPLRVDLGPDTTIRIFQKIYLEPFVNVPTQTITNIVWKGDLPEKCIDSCWLQAVAPVEKTKYFVTVTNRAGCQATDSITVFVDNTKRVYIPNIFSPNGDGINDAFVIYSGGDVSIVRSLKVWNRWGGTAFEATDFRPNDPAQAWNGSSPEGVRYNPDVFAYTAVIEFMDGTTEKFSGDVTLAK